MNQEYNWHNYSKETLLEMKGAGTRGPGETGKDVLQFMNKVKHEIIFPELRSKINRIGGLYYIGIHFVETDIQYKLRSDLLRMIEKGPIHLALNYKKSNYYKNQIRNKGRPHKKVLKKIVKYYILFRSIKSRGIRSDANDLFSFPWVFAAKEFMTRLDGHHRTSIARFLGYEEIAVLLITPKDISGLPGLSQDVLAFFGSLGQPQIPNTRPYGQVTRSQG